MISANGDQRQPDAARGLAGSPGARQQRRDPIRPWAGLPALRAHVVHLDRVLACLMEPAGSSATLEPAA